MLQSLLGTKLNQTQKFTQNGKRIPVTEIQAGPCPITQIKRGDKEGYFAVQIGFQTAKHPTKPALGHIKGAKLSLAPQFFHEVKIAEDLSKNITLGNVVNVSDVFTPGDVVKVTGTSKGKGFQGVVKRHGFHGGPKTHGQSDRQRHPGSIGATTTPGRVYKGKRMAGRMGGDTVTVKNLLVMDVDAQKNILTVEGLVPGAKNGLLTIIKTGSSKKFVPLLKKEEVKTEQIVEDNKENAEAKQ